VPDPWALITARHEDEFTWPSVGWTPARNAPASGLWGVADSARVVRAELLFLVFGMGEAAAPSIQRRTLSAAISRRHHHARTACANPITHVKQPGSSGSARGTCNPRTHGSTALPGHYRGRAKRRAPTHLPRHPAQAHWRQHPAGRSHCHPDGEMSVSSTPQTPPRRTSLGDVEVALI
jgi:hypothetical protein